MSTLPMNINYPTNVQAVLDYLNDEGFTSGVVGGFWRNHLYGLPTSDIDIAVLVEDSDEVEYLHKEFGTPAHLRDIVAKAEASLYEGHTGFVADWREGDINIVAYDKMQYATILELVHSFDFNFNMWCVGEDGNLVNPDALIHTKVVKLGNCHGSRPSIARAQRFARELPHWDWGNVLEDLTLLQGLCAYDR